MTIFLHKNDLPANVNFSGSIAVDSETMGLNIFRDRLCLVQISDGNGDAHLVKFDQNSYNAPNLCKFLADQNLQKLFHFARFDLAALQFYLKVEIQNIYCTKIASKLIRTYTDSHGLKALCDEMLGIDLSKKQQSSDWGNAELTDKQRDYAASDVLHLHKLKEKLDIMLVREGRMEIFQACLRFLPARTKLDLQGFTSTDIFAH